MEGSLIIIVNWLQPSNILEAEESTSKSEDKSASLRFEQPEKIKYPLYFYASWNLDCNQRWTIFKWTFKKKRNFYEFYR